MKNTFIFLSFLACLLSVFNYTTVEASQRSIIIDAGHGGVDGGASFQDVKESEINLEIALQLKEIFSSEGYTVYLTRETEDDLCDEEFVKRDDMNKRVQMINSSGSNLCISIHLNTFSSSRYRGAQVFYATTHQHNILLAQNIQQSIKFYMNNTNRSIVKRDNVYLLNKVTIPTALVECGFITNEEERNLLIDPDYQKKLAYSIYYGCVDFI